MSLHGQTPIVTGYRDFSFNTAGISAPTAQKPQSKLWYNDGLWWGALYDRASNNYTIFRFNTVAQNWTNTGVAVDNRPGAYIDTLWDGTHLYTLGAGINATSEDSARVRRYSYNGGTQTYTLDAGFPVTVANNGMEAAVMEKDSTGMLWVTYTQNNLVYVTHSNENDWVWVAPYVLPVGRAANVDHDDLSTIISFGDNQIGVFWSNQAQGAFYFAVHNDGASDTEWVLETALSGTLIPDDHINIKADSDGIVYVAAKTSLNDSRATSGSASLLRLLVRQVDGTWAWYKYSELRYQQTRPIVLLSEETRTIYMFATSPVGSLTNGWIYYKTTSMDDIAFPDGMGTAFIESPADTHINNATSTKQNLTCATGFLVVAADDSSSYYLHNYLHCG